MRRLRRINMKFVHSNTVFVSVNSKHHSTRTRGKRQTVTDQIELTVVEEEEEEVKYTQIRLTVVVDFTLFQFYHKTVY